MTGKPETSRDLRWVLALTSTAYFMVVLDALVVVTALPRMQRDLHVGLSSLQWTVNSYGIAFAAGIITAAALGDRFGRRRVFSIGLALFTVASAACALAPNAGELIAARTVQGLGGAVVLPLSLTILTTAFPAERRGLIVGIYGGLAGLAVASGPLIGGAVTQGLDWHWIFWINVPIGFLALALSTRLLPESHGQAKRLDPCGVALVTVGCSPSCGRSCAQTKPAGRAPRSSAGCSAGLRCCSRSSSGRVAWQSRWCRCGSSKAASSRSATRRPSSCPAPPSRQPSCSPRSSSSRAATRRCRPGCACCRSSRRPCSSRPSPGQSQTASGAGR